MHFPFCLQRKKGGGGTERSEIFPKRFKVFVWDRRLYVNVELYTDICLSTELSL